VQHKFTAAEAPRAGFDAAPAILTRVYGGKKAAEERALIELDSAKENGWLLFEKRVDLQSSMVYYK
jgi:hypothetical protein